MIHRLQRPSRLAVWIPLAYLLLVPPFLQGGTSSLAVLGVHTAILFLLGAVLLARPGTVSGVRFLPAPWIALGLCCGISLVSFLHVSYRFGSFVSLFNLVMYFLLVFSISRLSWSEAERVGCERVLLLSTFFQTLPVLYQFFLEPDSRPSGWFANPNHLAAFLLIGLWVATGRFLHGRSRLERSAAVTAAVFLLAAILSTGSRGALAALWVVLVAILFRWISRLGFRRTAAGLAAILVLALLAGGMVLHRFRGAVDPYRHARLRIWPAALRVAADHPILGVGPGMLESRAFNYNPPEEGGPVRYSKRFLSAHSSYLQILAETGVIGLICALAVAAFLLRRLFRNDSHPRAGPGCRWLGFALATLLVHGLVENLVGVPALVVALLIPAAIRISPDRRAGDRLGGRPGRALAAAGMALVYIFGLLVWLPYRADLHFRRMQAAGNAAAFAGHFGRAVAYNRFQPYYYSEAAIRILRGTRSFDLATFAICHGYLRTAIRLEPGEPRFHLEMARLYVRAFGELFRDISTRDRALAAYQAAFSLNRTDPRPLVEAARFGTRVGLLEESLDSLERALEVEPAYVQARVERLELLGMLDRLEERDAGLEGLKVDLRALEEYQPRNDYERSILALDSEGWEDLRSGT